MNIFVLDTDPKKCAEYHLDKHAVKMILETAQLLCGVHHMTDSQYLIPYKLSHKNHPCSIWARECVENYVWLCDLGLELCIEYTHRYGRRHKTQDVLEWCLTHIPKNLTEKGDITPFALAMPDEFKVVDKVNPIEAAVLSYRNYYMGDKRRMAKWSKREVPAWYI